MEWPRLKNIIILILLIANGFLLVLVAARRGESTRYERSALDNAVQVLEDRGIRVQTDAISPGASLAALNVERDLDRELRLAQALLGGEPLRADNRGGGLYLYENDSGSLSIRAGGELSAELSGGGAPSSGGAPENHAAALLKKMGIDGEHIGTAQEGGGTQVRFRQLWDGVPVFSCEVEFRYDGDGQLTAVRGTLLPADGGTAEVGQVMTLPTALLRFLDGVTAAGDVCSSIQSMQAGYRITAQSLSGGLRLTAVWLVSSDTADYYLDGATGALTRISHQ